MRDIAGERPVVRDPPAVEPIERLRTTLRQSLREASARTTDSSIPTSTTATCAGSFRTRPEHRRNRKASRFVQSIRRDVRRLVAEWTGSYQYTIDRVIEDMIARCERAQPAPEVSRRPHQARLHDARHRADDELPALGPSPGGALKKRRASFYEKRKKTPDVFIRTAA